MLALCLSQTVFAAPQISNATVPSNVGLYQKFEALFDVSTTATELFWPYETSVPVGIPAGVGVSVDGLFTNDDWVTTYKKPGFLFQRYSPENHPNTRSSYGEWAYPLGTPIWAVRFAPFKVGSWKFKIQVTDASGTTTYPSTGTGYSFVCTQSTSKGPIRVSQKDPRYFEFSDGTPFIPSVGLDDNMNYDVAKMETDYPMLATNGVKLIRHWWQSMSGLALFGNANSNRVGGNGIALIYDSVEHLPGKTLSWKLGLTSPTNEGTADVYCKPNTQYQVSAMVKTTNLIGSGNYGVTFYAYTGTQWGPVGSRLNGTNAWRSLSTVVNSGSGYLLHVKIVNENCTSGSANFTNFSIKEILPNSTFGPELVDKGNPDVFRYMGQFTAWKCERQLDIAEANGMGIKAVAEEKQDDIYGKINDAGVFDPALTNDGNTLYSSPTSANRRLQQYYWRMLIARFGHHNGLHSWELFNEADPYSGKHAEAANSFAVFMHQNNPNYQMVTTSNWHSYPTGEFWGQPAYQELDYTDVHRYVTVSGNTTNYGPYQPNVDPSLLMSRIVTGGRPNGTSARCAKVTAPTDGDGAWYGLMLCKVPVTAGRTYKVAVWNKGENIVWQGSGNPARPMMIVREATGWYGDASDTHYVGSTVMRTGTFDWEQQSDTFTVKPNTWFLQFFVFLTNTSAGSAYFDDITLQDTATGNYIKVPNGDFENPEPLYMDSAFEHRAFGELTCSPTLDRRQVKKPVVRGETGLYQPGQGGGEDEYLLLNSDVSNLWFKKKAWSHMDASAVIDLLYWRKKLDTYNRWGAGKNYIDFMRDIPINNGYYTDVQASVSNAKLRVYGQKDTTNSAAHVWIDNYNYNWKNVVDGIIAPSVTGSVTLSGFKPGIYTLEWWDTNTAVTRQEQYNSTNGNIVLSVSNLQSDVACKIFTQSVNANVVLSISLPTTTAKPGDIVSISVNYSNNGSADALNAAVSAKVPAGMDYVAGSAELSGGIYNSSNAIITWIINRIPINTAGSRTFQAKVK